MKKFEGRTEALFTTVLLLNAGLFLPFVKADDVNAKSSRVFSLSKKERSKKKLLSQKFHPRLGDGCLHVFIDAGSNKGVHGRFLFEPEKYPNNKFQRKFDEAFGPAPRDNSEICVFAFEPNPAHVAHQKATESAYQAMGWRYHFIPAAVGDAKERVVFHRNGGSVRKEAGPEEVGFSAIKRTGESAAEDDVAVEVIDFSAWLEIHVFRRRRPLTEASAADPAAGGANNGVVIMKMDIEGYEYPTLTHLLVKGTLCKFDAVYGELHPAIAAKMRGEPKMLRGKKEANEFFYSMSRVLRAAGCAPFQVLDDESYVHDTNAKGEEIPFPVK